MSDQTPRDINSGRPFTKAAKIYRERGWEGVLPLPAKKKYPPPTGWTGRSAPYPTDDDVNNWLGDPRNSRANIGLRLGGHIKKRVRVLGVNGKPTGKYKIAWFEVIGIDVDNYESGGKLKEGGKELAALEKRLGKLPATWISSARADGVSGIRYFLVPTKRVGRKYEFRGQVSAAIEMIQAAHRFAVVYPSYHPDGGQYLWYEPGTLPNGKPDRSYDVKWHEDGTIEFVEPEEALSARIPSVDDLPFLPDRWLEYLTNGLMEASDRPIDMDSSVKQIEAWARKNLAKPHKDIDGRSTAGDDGMCKDMRKAPGHWKQQILDDATSHDKIRDAHWNIICLGVEGHPGWRKAAASVERIWTRDVLSRGKRGAGEARLEMFRSRINAIRKVKAKVEEAAVGGSKLVARSCGCFNPDVLPVSDSQLVPVGASSVSDPSEYRLNDDGNADHLTDLFGDSLIWVPGYGKWMFWSGKRWLVDEDGLARRCFRQVRDRQEAYVQTLMVRWLEALEDAGGDTKAPEVVKAKAAFNAWSDFSRRSGSNIGANGALEAAKNNDGVSVPAEQMDQNQRLLGVNNGIIELGKDGFSFRQAQRDDFVTVNTGVDFMYEKDILQGNGFASRQEAEEARHGLRLWQAYLDRFLPVGDGEGAGSGWEYRRFVQKVLGYCLLGSNEQRLAIFLYGGTSTGKSTMLNAVMAAMGDYAETVDLSIFKERASGLNPALAQAMPRRIITSSEAGFQNHMHADIFKRMTGNDRMSAELKGVNTIVTRIPAFTPLIATNTPPTIKGADAALHKRLLILPFDKRVPDNADEKSASVELAGHGAKAVLAWLLEGWNMYANEGLDSRQWPAKVGKTTSTFAMQLSDIGEFVQERVQRIKTKGDGTGEKERVSVAEMYDEYQQWCLRTNIPQRDVLAKNKFGAQMREMGFESRGICNKTTGMKSIRFYIGVQLRGGGAPNGSVKYM